MVKTKTNRHAHNFKDEIGNKFGRLTVLSYAGRTRRNMALWLCQCDNDGNQVIVAGSALRNGNSTSCGCYRYERVSEVCTTHGLTDTPEHQSWRAAKDRCFNTNHEYYARYGGRGITMQQQWRDSFEAFLKDMGPRPPGTELDRIDNDGPYTGPCPEYPEGNCRWVPRRINSNNTRRNVLITHDGETLTMKEWAARTGIPYGTLHARRIRGLPMFTPLKKK